VNGLAAQSIMQWRGGQVSGHTQRLRPAASVKPAPGIAALAWRVRTARRRDTVERTRGNCIGGVCLVYLNFAGRVRAALIQDAGAL
jgi:hypothetical protein